MNNELIDLLTGDITPEELSGEVTVESARLTSPEDTTAVLLSALEGVCDPEEFHELAYESANLFATYGIYHDADEVRAAYESIAPAIEASIPSKKKTIVITTKATVMDRATKQAMMRLAKNAGDPNYEKYRKYKKLMVEYRQKIRDKWESKAKKEARRILMGKGQTAAAVKDTRGRQMEDKIKDAIEKTNSEGRNHKAIKA